MGTLQPTLSNHKQACFLNHLLFDNLLFLFGLAVGRTSSKPDNILTRARGCTALARERGFWMLIWEFSRNPTQYMGIWMSHEARVRMPTRGGTQFGIRTRLE